MGPERDASLRRLREVFSVVDLNNTGRISLPDFAALSVLSSHMAPDKKTPAPNFNQFVVTLFAELDADGDERLREAEWMSFRRMLWATNSSAGPQPPVGCENVLAWYESNA